MVNELLRIGDDPLGVSDSVTMSCDCETTGLKWEDSRLLGVSLAWRDHERMQSCYLALPTGQMGLFAMDGSLTRLEFIDLLKVRRLVLHNHAFDYRWLWRSLGVPPLAHVVDTQHLAKHIQPHEKLDLLTLYRIHVATPSPAWVAMKARRGSLEKLSAYDVAPYARTDAEHTLELYEVLRVKAAKMESIYLKLYDWDERFEFLVMQMVVRGLPVDREWCERKIVENHRAMIAVNTEIVPVGIRNPGAQKDVMAFANANGLALDSTEEAELSKQDNPVLRKVVEYRELAKANGSWLEPLLKLSEFDGYFHPELHPFGTVSFRMSSRDLNAQGIPMGEHDKRAGGSMLGVFKSKLPGQELWAIDLKQAEVRLAAILSGDQQLQQQLATGDDPYVALATSIWGDPSKRSDAKRAMLSSIYEVGPHTFSERYGGTEAEARAVLDAFRNRYPQTRRHSKTQANFVDRHRFVELITGRPRFYFDEPSYSAFNQEVQGSLAELAHEWMLRFEHEMPGRLVLQVHDSLVAYLSADDAARAAEVNVAEKLVQDVALDMIPGYKKSPVPPILVDSKKWQL